MNEMLQQRINELNMIVKDMANEVSHSMSTVEKDSVYDIFEQIEILEDMLNEFDELISEVWSRAEVFWYGVCNTS